jgi:ubiquinol-cytochrome c reductase cytochrome b subunit
MGYLLPWGQMSYWGAQVIVNLFAAIPFIGPDLALLIRGDYVVGDATLNRFFAFHVIAVPLVLLGLVVAHLIALHEVGSNNPDGVEIKAHKDANGKPLDGIAFHPYYTVHDIFGVSVFLMVFSAIIFFAPEAGGYFLEYNNFIPADPLKTPAHIAPVWYFTPYYSMLRAITGEMAGALGIIAIVAAVLASRKLVGIFKPAVLVVAIGAALLLGLLPSIANWVGLVAPSAGTGIANGLDALAAPLASVPFLGEVWNMLVKGIDAKFWGVVVMGGAVVIMFFLPWLDHSPVNSIRYRPDWHKYLYGIFVLNFLVLGYLGVQPPSTIGERVSQLGTLFYFGFFLLMPWWSRLGTPKTPPDRVTFHAH